ncbi:MAG: mechanosensitive ion channel family protein [Armatimonadetes bacterium]|nr:mechanosensitive ion channel family protein [Armatimonadota bacterium]
MPMIAFALPDQLASISWDQGLVAVGEATAKILLIIVVYVLVRWGFTRGLDAVTTKMAARVSAGSNYTARLRTLQALLRSLVSYGLGFVAFVMVLNTLGLNVAAILAGAGVVGLAVGFGAQRLVRDVITGMFILVEDQFAVGDYVTIGNHSGTVSEMGMRITRLRDDQGKEVILANGDISTVVNHSRGPMAAAIDVAVGAQTSLHQLQEVVGALGPALSEELFVPTQSGPRIQGITSMDASRVVVRIVAAARPGEVRRAEMALRAAVREAFAREGIPLA